MDAEIAGPERVNAGNRVHSPSSEHQKLGAHPMVSRADALRYLPLYSSPSFTRHCLEDWTFTPCLPLCLLYVYLLLYTLWLLWEGSPTLLCRLWTSTF